MSNYHFGRQVDDDKNASFYVECRKSEVYPRLCNKSYLFHSFQTDFSNNASSTANWSGSNGTKQLKHG
jgi:hypothetical protein